MTFLDQFRETRPDSNGKDVDVFRMDNTTKSVEIPDMRAYVGLGSCNCCDYFFINADKIFVVEETRLADTIKTIEKQYSYLIDDDKKDCVVKNVRQENYVKVYGSLLVLCRLAAKCKEDAKRMQDKKHDFWLVISDGDTEETSVVVDNLSDNLFEQLCGVLTRKVVDKVEIIPSNILPEKLSANATPT